VSEHPNPNEERRARTQRANATIAHLAELFPKTFFVYEQRRRPIKVGIRGDLAPLVSVTDEELTIALGYYTRNGSYLRACTEGVPRVDLSGNGIGVVSRDEAEHAREKLAVVLARRKPKRQQRSTSLDHGEVGSQRCASSGARPTDDSAAGRRETGACAQQPEAKAIMPVAPKGDGLAELRAAAARRREGAGA
jgi:ProP effector